MSRLAIALCLVAFTAPADGQGVDAQYTLSLRGITGGQIALRGRDVGGRYSVSSAARATGLVGSLVKYGFDGSAQGQISGGRYLSEVYSEREDDDGTITQATTQFRGMRPVSVTFDPPRVAEPFDIDPTGQSGVIDPLTALYAILQPVARAEACDQGFDLFDGRHVSRISLGPAQTDADGMITCAGEYRRLRGYSEDELAKRGTVEMTFQYAPVGEGRVQVSEIRSSTRLGVAVLRRD